VEPLLPEPRNDTPLAIGRWPLAPVGV